METLPHNFLIDLQKITKIKPSNLSRYFSGVTTPRPARAEFLSKSLDRVGINVPPEFFFIKKDQIKPRILEQLKEKAA